MRIGKPKKGFTEALVLTVALLAILLTAVWQLASNPVSPEAERLQEEVDFLSGELVAIKERLERVSAREHVLEREAAVLRRANQLLQESESNRQSELNRLKSELDFYRRLAGIGGAQPGLDVYRTELARTDSDRVFRFELTLTQNIRRASVISGQATIDIEGIMKDRAVRLSWPDLNDGSTPQPAFRFRYFQQLEGYLTLPEGFSPTRLLVTLAAEGRQNPIERAYVWEDMLLAAPD
jgi:hypothetical protein